MRLTGGTGGYTRIPSDRQGEADGPSRAARLCVAGWRRRWREMVVGLRVLKGGKGRRENERGEARRAREASVVSVRPL